MPVTIKISDIYIKKSETQILSITNFVCVCPHNKKTKTWCAYKNFRYWATNMTNYYMTLMLLHNMPISVIVSIIISITEFVNITMAWNSFLVIQVGCLSAKRALNEHNIRELYHANTKRPSSLDSHPCKFQQNHPIEKHLPCHIAHVFVHSLKLQYSCKYNFSTFCFSNTENSKAQLPKNLQYLKEYCCLVVIWLPALCQPFTLYFTAGET